MVSVRSVLRQIPDPRGKKGRLHRLEAIIGLMLLSMLSGRRGMLAAHRLGRSLSRRELNRLGFRRDRASPCHATLTETLRILDADAMERAFGQIVGFGTSTPELLVSVNAALDGAPEIALGNVVGSNIANILLIIGIAAAIAPNSGWDRSALREEFVATLVALATLGLVHAAAISQLHGAVMLTVLAAYLFSTYWGPSA